MNCRKTKLNVTRRATISVLFAIVLPVLLIIAAIAINIAHMQLTRTELKISTDAAARAGGRAWSEFQDVDQAKEFARRAAALNEVAGQPLVLRTNESDGEIVFGESKQQGNNRFVFTPVTEGDVEDNFVTGIQVNATHTASMFFQVGETSSFSPSASSVASQTERDIALVIDRSGSMAYFEGQETALGMGENFLYDEITTLYENASNSIERADYINAVADYHRVNSLAAMSLNAREYSSDILSLLTGDLKRYAETLNSKYRSGSGAPDFSRWHMLEQAYGAFFDVLDQTVQTEFVSVASFASSARLDAELTSNLELCRGAIAGVRPTGSTSIGDGMWEAYVSLKVENARQSAVKTLIIFSDGVNKSGMTPVEAANKILDDNPNVVMHTVTFGAEADKATMESVAEMSTGDHFHASNGDELIEVFRYLAASHRTVITE